MSDKIKFELTGEEADLIKAFDKTLDKGALVEGMAEGIQEALDEAFGKGAKSIEDFNKMLEKNTGKLNNSNAGLKKYKAVMDDAGKAVDSALRKQRIFGVEVGDVADKLDKYIGKLRGLDKAQDKVGKSTGKLGARMGRALGVIGLVIAALQGLKKIMESTVSGSNALERAWAGLSGATDTLLVRLKNLDFKGLAKDMRESAKEAARIKGEFQQLAAIQGVLANKIAQQRTQTEKNIALGEDERRTFQERQQSYQEALEVQQAFEQGRNNLLQREIDLQRELVDSFEKDSVKRVEAQQRLTELLVQQQEFEEEAIGKRKEIEAGLFMLQQEAAQARKEAQEAELARVKQLQDEYLGLLGAFDQAARQAALDVLTQPEKIIALRDQALQEIDELKAQIIRKADELGRDLPPAFEENFAKMRDDISLAAEIQLADFRDEVAPLLALDADSLFTDFQEGTNAARNISAFARSRVNEFKDAYKDPLTRFKEEILIALSISEEEAQMVFSQLQGVFEGAAQLFQVNQELRLKAIDERIEKRQDEINRLEKQLSKESDLRDKGLANNFKSTQDALQKETQLLKEEEQKRLQAEKEAANRRLLAASLEQAAQITLAVSKAIAAEAGKGIIGLIIGAGAASIIFKAVANAKSQAAELAPKARLRKGKKFDRKEGYKMEGRSHEDGGNILDIIGPSGQVVERYEAEADEHLIGTAHSREHDKFLTKLNKGRYRGVDLESVADRATSAAIAHSAKQRRISENFDVLKQQQEKQAMKEAYKEAAEMAANRIVDAIENIPALAAIGKDEKLIQKSKNVLKVTDVSALVNR